MDGLRSSPPSEESEEARTAEREITRDVRLAVRHCEHACQMQPDQRTASESDTERSPAQLQAEAYFLLGSARLLLGKEREAVDDLEESLRHEPNQETLFNIALSWESKRMGKTKKGIWGTLVSAAMSRLLVPKERVLQAYRRCVSMDPLSSTGLKAAMQMERLEGDVLERTPDAGLDESGPAYQGEPSDEGVALERCLKCGSEISEGEGVCSKCGFSSSQVVEDVLRMIENSDYEGAALAGARILDHRSCNADDERLMRECLVVALTMLGRTDEAAQVLGHQPIELTGLSPEEHAAVAALYYAIGSKLAEKRKWKQAEAFYSGSVKLDRSNQQYRTALVGVAGTEALTQIDRDGE